MKKIGILTYFKEYSNLGTNMQAYCTFKAIQKEYPDAQVELINYLGWTRPMRPYFSNISLNSLKKDNIRFKKYYDFFKKELTFSKNKLITSDLKKSIEFIKKQNYNAIYVGSDTVLELRKAQKDNLTTYWLDNSINCKKFLIAASSFNLINEALSTNQKYQIQKSIDCFSLLGVRDDATFRLLSNFIPSGDKRLQIIPDPTFTYEIDYSYVEQYIKRKRLHFSKPIVCFHLTRDTIWAKSLANYFKKEGYVVASLRPAYYADIIFTDLSPFEQMGIYKYFDLVITHRFHDSIFCFKNFTPVIVFPKKLEDVTLYGESKYLSLFKSFHLEKTNYIDNKDKITVQYLFDMSKEAINNFAKKRDFIKVTLQENKEKYESFVRESKKIFLE
jgi:hypothetical protein